jgi:hypothetical protein
MMVLSVDGPPPWLLLSFATKGAYSDTHRAGFESLVVALQPCTLRLLTSESSSRTLTHVTHQQGMLWRKHM